MGCLTLTARVIPADIVVTAENKNGIVVMTENHNELFVDVETKNVKPAVSVANLNTGLGITAGLVCRLSLGIYEYLDVSQGSLIVENGYLKVRRQRS